MSRNFFPKSVSALVRRLITGATSALLTSACGPSMASFKQMPNAQVAMTGGVSQSMIYLGETAHGIFVIDLGWVGAERVLEETLVGIGSRPSEVRTVFLTHSHRDHISGWQVVREATFYMGAHEVPRFIGEEEHLGLVPRLLERFLPSPRPKPGDLKIIGLERDTVLVLGTDTVHAFLVPGHTAGSVAYLVQGILFVGDAISWSPFTGFRPDRPIYSDDSARNRLSVVALWERLPVDRVRWVCTAHGKCARYSQEFLHDSGQ